MLTEDVIVYLHPAHKGEYVAAFGTVWWRWPATQRGWIERRRLPSEPDVDCMQELAPSLGDLALRLSGVTQ